MTNQHVPAEVASLLDTDRELTREEMDTLIRYADLQWLQLQQPGGQSA